MDTSIVVKVRKVSWLWHLLELTWSSPLGRSPCYQWEGRRGSDYWWLSGLSRLCVCQDVQVCLCVLARALLCGPLAIHTYAGRWVSKVRPVCGGCMLLFGYLSFCLFVVLESLNLGDAGDRK